jgi:toxin ParE1/3/4
MSARKRRLVLSPSARNDLSDLLLYTERRWGKRQRAAYQALIDRALRELARFPDLGRARDEIAAGLRGHPAGNHIILYRVSDEELTVARILHARQDAEGAIEDLS